jgi:NADP-reducing hydrogenase subunit HndB
MKKLTREEIERMANPASGANGSADAHPCADYIRVGMSSCGIAAGAEEVLASLIEEAKKRNIEIVIEKCGCLGMCFAEPLVEVKVDGLPPVVYGKVNSEIAAKIIEKHVVSKMLVNDCIFDFKVKE